MLNRWTKKCVYCGATEVWDECKKQSPGTEQTRTECRNLASYQTSNGFIFKEAN